MPRPASQWNAYGRGAAFGRPVAELAGLIVSPAVHHVRDGATTRVQPTNPNGLEFETTLHGEVREP